MGGVAEWLNRNHMRVANVTAASLAWLPFYSLYWGATHRPITDDQADLIALGTVAPGIGWVAAHLAAYGVVAGAALRKPERMRARAIQAEVFAEPRAVVPRGSEVGVSLSWREGLEGLRYALSWDPVEAARRAQESRNPYLAQVAAGKFFLNDRADEGLEWVRNSVDWLDGRSPRLSWRLLPMEALHRFASAVQTRLFPENARVCMEAALFEALRDPVRAQAWSECGRRIGRELDSKWLNEAYVFYALLASAQRRDDEQEAWKEALGVLMASCAVEPVSERESRSEVFRFTGGSFRQTVLAKRRVDVASLRREYDWQRGASDRLTACAVPRAVYVSQSDDGLSCFAMRYRSGDVVYDLLEKGEKSAVPQVARALGEIHARMPLDGLVRAELWKAAKDKLYDPNLGVPRELANTILAQYGPVERGCWLAPGVVNKDAHPEQWIKGDGLTALDWELDKVVPLTLDSANFASYRGFLDGAEQRAFVGDHVAAYRDFGGAMRGEDVLSSFYNAVIHRMVCFAGAWSGPSRKKMRAYRGEALLRAVDAVDALQNSCASFYKEYSDEYRILRRSFVALADLMVP